MVKIIPSSPEWEQKYQFVQQQYNTARSIGIDILKFYLQVIITTLIIPIIFRQQTIAIFGNDIGYIYTSWIYISFAIFLGIMAYVMIFEGYYHQSHMECSRHLNNDEDAQEKIQYYFKKSNSFFDMSHIFGIGSFVSFGLSLSFFMFAVIRAIFR